MSKKIVLGILAHVDAGKTTLSEAMLFLAGKIKKLGRVDDRDTYLDTHGIERKRGITIFAKQAVFSVGETEITLLDTPGHVDFSTEAERTLQVLDYAVLVVSGTDGVQAHTETLWRLLRRYHIPTLIFVTKADMPGFSHDTVLADLKKNLGEKILDFSSGGDKDEIAVCDDALLRRYLETEEIIDSDVALLLQEEKLFPCYYGSGLRLNGVEELLHALDRYALKPCFGEPFGARVFKIARDHQNNRLTYMKITGGTLRVRDVLCYTGEEGEIKEKANQLRIYSGEKFTAVEEASAGMVCAVLGLTKTFPGLGFGTEAGVTKPILEPVLTYRLTLPDEMDPLTLLPKLRLLAEEDPELCVVWDEELREIHLRLMGQIQIEVIESLIAQRFAVEVHVDEGKILYKETIAEAVVGMGHFEPLRHYAEVHLLLEPLAPGSGIVFDSRCPEDLLAKNWQRLILSQLESNLPAGVLTGAPLTDMKITLIAGRAHQKHTEGGDFRQAACRALRQGLMQAKSILLEPYYNFTLKIPGEQLGRAIHDIQAMNGTFSAPKEEGELMVLSGSAAVAAMGNYFSEVVSYTKGRGSLNCTVLGYRECKSSENIIAGADYDPERDTRYPCDSVFCSHGTGANVRWNQAAGYMHVDSGVKIADDRVPSLPDPKIFAGNFDIDEKELNAIMEREFGSIKRRQYRTVTHDDRIVKVKETPRKGDYLIVDGYNMIFAWEGLKELAEEDLSAARHRLTELLCNYRGFVHCELILVFDGYKMKGNRGERFDVNDIHVVYTPEGQTGDMYIEKLLKEIGSHYNVRVATSDALIQLSALGSGVLRMSAYELKEEIDLVQQRIDAVLSRINGKK